MRRSLFLTLFLWLSALAAGVMDRTSHPEPAGSPAGQRS